MGRMFTYQVKVGQNVPSLKSGPGAPALNFRLQTLAPGRLTAETARKGFEVPTVTILAGLLLAALGYWISGREEFPPYAMIGLGAAVGLGGAVLLLYGIGLISARQRLIIAEGTMEYQRTFFWLTRRKTLERSKPEEVLCTAAKQSGEPPYYRFSCCLRLGEAPGSVPVFHLDGHAQIRESEAMRCQPYETALLEIHEKAAEIAQALDIPLKPNFHKGPLTDNLKALFKDGAGKAS